MGRIKAPNRRKMENWDAINEGLRRIAELDAAIGVRTNTYNEEDAKRRKVLDDFCNPLRGEKEEIELGMEDFCVANRADFGKTKSKELPNGVVSFRNSTPKVEKAKGLTWEKVLEVLKGSKLKKRFVRTKTEINKEQILAEYSACEDDKSKKKLAEELNTVFLHVTQDETFGYEPIQAVEVE